MTRIEQEDPFMTRSDIPDPVSPADATAFTWTSRDGRARPLGALDADHRRNLAAYLVREIASMEAAQDTFMLTHVDPEISPGFSGIETRLSHFEDALRHLRALEGDRQSADSRIE